MKLKLFVKINGVPHEVEDGLIAFDAHGAYYSIENLVMNLNVYQLADAQVESPVGIDLPSTV